MTTSERPAEGAAQQGATEPQWYVQALALRVDPAWRRLDAAQRRADAAESIAAHAAAAELGVRSFSYSMVGIQPGAELLFWRMGPSLEALEAAGSRLLTAGVGRWATVAESLIGRIGPSQYVRRPTPQEQSLFEGERQRYLIVYPFTKSTEWYLLGREARQGIMNEHMRVGHDYPSVRQLLAYSFGLDDQDFVVAYETDDLVAFGDLVRALRSTESRRSTVRDTPILTAIHHPLETCLELLGG
jgi:chlorite dismutase